MDPRFGEYEVKKLRSPACSRQENAIIPLHIHGTWDPPFSASLYSLSQQEVSADLMVNPVTLFFKFGRKLNKMIRQC